MELLFLNNDKIPAHDKQAFNVQSVLTCSAPWVSNPQYLDLMFTARRSTVQESVGEPVGDGF